LGSQKLLLFQIDYLLCDENVDEDLLKIHSGIYTERQPFNEIYCFCTIFMELYWNNSIDETVFAKKERKGLLIEVRKVFKKHYRKYYRKPDKDLHS